MGLFKTDNGSESDNNKNKNKGDGESSKYKDAFKVGSSIAGTITSRWNSQETPGKVYVANRRIHHGGIGRVMKLSKYFKKSEPTAAGIVSGIGEGLAKDDYTDKKEWFKFKKKEDESPSSTTETPSASKSSESSESQETSSIESQQSKSSNEGKSKSNAPI
jgi:hypothetical protein